MSLTFFRNSIEHAAYTRLLKPYFFRRDPELVHNRMLQLGERLGKGVVGRAVTAGMFRYSHPSLEQTVRGIRFANPIGLAAGFDKNARLLDILPMVGFGFVEVGSITARPYAGNPAPRLYRLPVSRSLVVNYGLMNDGSEMIARRLAGRQYSVPVGISLAPTNDDGTAEFRAAIDDYLVSYQRFAKIGDYTTLNLSCPNTCHDQPFTAADRLDELLTELDKIDCSKPIFLKISPDLPMERVRQLIKTARNRKVAGFICTNLTKNRENQAIKESKLPATGGLSGKIVDVLSDRMIAFLAKETAGEMTIIGCGGVFTPEDAYRKIRLGSSLIQMITGMIYEGPEVISMINEGLVRLLIRDGFTSITDAVGKDL